jgi:hypothetical protein
MGVLRPSVFALFVLVMVLLFGSLFMAAEKKQQNDHAGKVFAAVRKGDAHAAAVALADWCQADQACLKSPLYHALCERTADLTGHPNVRRDALRLCADAVLARGEQ